VIRKLIGSILSRPAVYNLSQRIARSSIVEEIIRDEVKRDKPSRVLDLACGAGLYSRLFPPHGYIGIDKNLPYIRFARGCDPRKSFAVMDIRHLAFKKGSFTSAITIGVLHHLDAGDITHALRELKYVLAPGAKIITFDIEIASSVWDIAGMLAVNLDRGRFARSEEGYRAILIPHFAILRHRSIKRWPYRFCAFVLERH
jgi:SAM-dependent methyltransferase